MLTALRQHCRFVLAGLPAQRLLALDVLRGITIMAMILVNNPGSWQYIYAPLRHANWHGWTPTDLIFPFFIVIVGISLQLSLSAQHNVSRRRLLINACRRALILVLLGLFLAAFYFDTSSGSGGYLQQKLQTLRWPGVLQRIGVVYLCTVVVVLFFGLRGRLLILLVLCVIYLLAMWCWPYTDAGGQRYTGLFEHGNNFAAWLDDTLLGANHVFYRQATPFAFDPEGVWSTLPTVASCLTGVLMAQWLQRPVSLQQKISGLLMFAVFCIGLGELWHSTLPVNKYLWTPSFVLLSSGYCAAALAICLWLCDVKQYRLWAAPFVVFGANALLFFMLAGITARALVMIPAGSGSLQQWLFRQLYQPVLGNYNGSLAYAISFLLLSYLVMYGCYRRGYIFRV